MVGAVARRAGSNRRFHRRRILPPRTRSWGRGRGGRRGRGRSIPAPKIRPGALLFLVTCRRIGRHPTVIDGKGRGGLRSSNLEGGVVLLHSSRLGLEKRTASGDDGWVHCRDITDGSDVVGRDVILPTPARILMDGVAMMTKEYRHGLEDVIRVGGVSQKVTDGV